MTRVSQPERTPTIANFATYLSIYSLEHLAIWRLSSMEVLAAAFATALTALVVTSIMLVIEVPFVLLLGGVSVWIIDMCMMALVALIPGVRSALLPLWLATILSKTIGLTLASIGLNSRLRAPDPYVAVLAKRLQVCIKVATSHGMADLTAGALAKLARAVERLGVVHGSRARRGCVVLGASVRHGCILVGMEINMPSLPSSAGGSQGSADVLEWAKQLLPCVLEELGLGADGDGLLLQPGEYLSLQVGGHVVHATMDPHTREWQFSIQPREQATIPQLGMARTYTAAPQPPPTQTPAGMHLVSFAVELTHATRAVDGSHQETGGVPAQAIDPSAASTSQASTSSNAPAGTSTQSSNADPGLQLRVQSQGHYLRTIVQRNGDAHNPGVDSPAWSTTLQAHVQMPINAMARHHLPDGPTARMELLSAELWAGDALLSSTPLFVDAQQHLLPTLPCTFGWWGVSVAPTVGLVFEITALATQSAADMDDSNQPFISDLATWLTYVQSAAPDTCCDMYSPSEAPTHSVSGVNPRQFLALSQNLLTYATSNGLRGTQATLRAQCLNVLGADWQLPARVVRRQLAASAHAFKLWLWQIVMYMYAWVLCIRPCSECDIMYYNRLRQHLHLVSCFTALVCIAGGVVATSKQLILADTPSAWLSTCLLAICAVLQILGVATTHLLPSPEQPGQPPANPGRGLARVKYWLFYEGGFFTLSWCGRLSASVSVAPLSRRLSEAFCNESAGRRSNMIIIIYLNIVLSWFTEKIHLWGRLPNSVFRYFLLCEAVVATRLQSQCNHTDNRGGLERVALPLLSLCFPFIMDQYWRRRLRPPGGSSRRRQTAGQQPHED